MRRPGRLPRPPLCGLLAVLAWALTAGPLWACTDRASVWDWDRCWVSLTRWLVLLGLGSGWWFLCFHRLFPLWLAPTRNDAPLPRVAFRRCLALWCLLMTATVVVLYAWLSDELSGPSRLFPASLGFLNRSWKWLLVLLIGGGLALAIWAPGRRSRAAPGSPPPAAGPEET